MRIEVNQLPPIECSPNWRGHWAQRHQAARIYQEAVFYECVDAINRAYREGRLAFTYLPFKKVKLNLTFVYPQHRRRDRDNLLAMFKPGLDAIIAAGLVADDDVEHLEIGQVNVDVSRTRAPLTIIELEAVAGRNKEAGGGRCTVVAAEQNSKNHKTSAVARYISGGKMTPLWL